MGRNPGHHALDDTTGAETESAMAQGRAGASIVVTSLVGDAGDRLHASFLDKASSANIGDVTPNFSPPTSV